MGKHHNLQALELKEFGKFLKNVLEFILTKDGVFDRVYKIRWIIQYFTLDNAKTIRGENIRYFLDVEIVGKDPVSIVELESQVVNSIKKHFEVNPYESDIIETLDGEKLMSIRMHLPNRSLYVIRGDEKGIPKRFASYTATISIKSLLLELGGVPQMIFSSEELELREKLEVDKYLQEREALLREMQNYKKPIIICEGKSDVQIIKTAWLKLYGTDDMPFDVIASGVYENPDKSEGNADQVRKALEYTSEVIKDQRILIGLFDNDKEGRDQLERLKPGVFENLGDYRKHKNHSIYGLVLPVPEKRKLFEGYFCIEHYFEDEILGSYGMIGDKIVPDSQVFRISKTRGKKWAFSIDVNQLDPSSFASFKVLFDKILEIVPISSST